MILNIIGVQKALEFALYILKLIHTLQGFHQGGGILSIVMYIHTIPISQSRKPFDLEAYVLMCSWNLNLLVDLDEGWFYVVVLHRPVWITKSGNDKGFSPSGSFNMHSRKRKERLSCSNVISMPVGDFWSRCMDSRQCLRSNSSQGTARRNRKLSRYRNHIHAFREGPKLFVFSR